MKQFKITKIVRVNENFIDVHYTWRSLLIKHKDRVSIHISDSNNFILDGYGLLSEELGHSINSDMKRLKKLRKALLKKGWVLK
jgi:hypothetical protein